MAFLTETQRYNWPFLLIHTQKIKYTKAHSPPPGQVRNPTSIHESTIQLVQSSNWNKVQFIKLPVEIKKKNMK